MLWKIPHRKKIWKNLQKSVDKGERMWYYNQALSKRGAEMDLEN